VAGWWDHSGPGRFGEGEKFLTLLGMEA